MNTIPQYLFRGDADTNGIRKLRDGLPYNQFHTNLIFGGQGRAIFEEPLKKLIKDHVAIGWQHTHFLSFTENTTTAYRYGTGNLKLQEEEIDANFIDHYDTTPDWDFALLTLHSEKVKWKQLNEGVFEGSYKPSLTLFSKDYNEYRVILMHVATILAKANDNAYKDAFTNAVRDTEWLLLPATPVIFNNNQIQYSAILDGSCIDLKKIKAL